MKFRINDIFIYGFIGPGILIWHILDRFKLIYAAPVFLFLLIAFAVFQNSKRDDLFIEKDYLRIAGAFTLLLIASLTVNWGTLENNDVIFRDIILYLSPLLIFSTNIIFTPKHVAFLFLICIGCYFATVGFPTNFTMLKSLFDSGDLNPENEFHEGIIFGLFVIYFAQRKRILWLVLAVVFCLLVNKRALFLGLIPAIGSFVFIRFIFRNNKNAVWAFSLLYYVAFLMLAIFLEPVSEYLLKIFGRDDITINYFLKGRELFNELLLGEIFQNNINFIFGHGPAQADVFLQYNLPKSFDYWIENKPVNPHNDYLKIFYDLGLAGIVAYFFVSFKMYVRGSYGLPIFLYTLPLFVVDNSLVIIHYLLIGCIIARTESDAEAKWGLV